MPMLLSNAANKGKHQHWRPPKGSTLALYGIHHIMADKKEIDINGMKYSVALKKVDTTPQASDVTINGVTYSINMMNLSIPLNTKRTEHFIVYIIKLGYASCSYALAGIHDNFTLIPNTVPFTVPSLTTDASIAMCTYPTFIATSANASTNHMTIRDYAPMSSMSLMVHISDESENFCVALTLTWICLTYQQLTMSFPRLIKILLRLLVWSFHWLLRRKQVFSLPL